MSKEINTTGYVLKEETVSPLTGPVMKNSFVINVDHPFPGYYGQEMVDQSTPRAIIFITKKEHSWEDIIRARDRVNAYLEMNIDISKAKVTMWNKTFPGIRAKGFGDFGEIEPYQRALVEEGFGMMKRRRMGETEVALLNVKKFYNLIPLDEGCFQDADRPEMTYALLPGNPNWELFRKVTMIVKNNISDPGFDVAKGAFYYQGRILDMIRVFKPKTSPELLKEMKTLYERALHRYGRAVLV